MCMTTTRQLREARKLLARFNIRMTITAWDQEYRVAFRDAPASRAEASAYYTDDLGDAIATALLMDAEGWQA